mgnify:CR=1 FL=1
MQPLQLKLIFLKFLWIYWQFIQSAQTADKVENFPDRAQNIPFLTGHSGLICSKRKNGKIALQITTIPIHEIKKKRKLIPIFTEKPQIAKIAHVIKILSLNP